MSSFVIWTAAWGVIALIDFFVVNRGRAERAASRQRAVACLRRSRRGRRARNRSASRHLSAAPRQDVRRLLFSVGGGAPTNARARHPDASTGPRSRAPPRLRRRLRRTAALPLPRRTGPIGPKKVAAGCIGSSLDLQERPANAGLSRGVSDGTRTRDHLDHNQELYQLSYAHRATRSVAVRRPRTGGPRGRPRSRTRGAPPAGRGGAAAPSGPAPRRRPRERSRAGRSSR